MNEELREAIETEDLEELYDLLDEIKLNSLTHQEAMKLALIILHTATGKPEVFKICFDFFEHNLEHFETKLFLMPEIRAPGLAALVRYISTESLDVTLTSLMSSYIEFEQNNELSETLTFCRSVFPTLTESMARQIYTLARAEGSTVVAEHAAEELKKVIGYAPIPKYLKKVKKLPRVELFEEVEIPENPDLFIEAVFSSMEKAMSIEGDMDEMKRALKERYLKGNPDEVEAMKDVIKEAHKVDELDLFHVFGPVNGNYSNASHFCKSTGGCRMMTCLCLYENDVRETELSAKERVKVWFRPNCFRCLRRIKAPQCAFRLANRTGGWKHPFCSAECHVEHIMSPALDQSNKGDSIPVPRHQVNTFVAKAQLGEDFEPEEVFYEIFGTSGELDKVIDELQLVADLYGQLASKGLYIETKK